VQKRNNRAAEFPAAMDMAYHPVTIRQLSIISTSSTIFKLKFS